MSSMVEDIEGLTIINSSYGPTVACEACEEAMVVVDEGDSEERLLCKECGFEHDRL